jgi:DNA-binding beta-propeller fold protein YncE
MKHFAWAMLAIALFLAVMGPGHADYQFAYSFGSWGTGDGQFDMPTGVAVTADGLVYVADTNNDRVQVFSSEPHSGIYP